jgi:hypothetical protein
MLSFCDCSNGLEQAQLLRTVGKLARAGEQAGFSIEEMIEMLNSGMSVADLLNLITRRLSQLSQLPSNELLRATRVQRVV